MHQGEWVRIEKLRPTQIYLSQRKVESVLTWFTKELDTFQPVPVYDFLENGDLCLTDGHTRTYAAWMCGIKEIPVIYDDDETVTGDEGKRLYMRCLEWCDWLAIHDISVLAGRILDEDAYQAQWLARCSSMHRLDKALMDGELDKNAFNHASVKLKAQGLLVYGISDDLATLRCEDQRGQLSDISY